MLLPPAMWASQGTSWLLHRLILYPVLCFLNQRGGYCTKKMLSNCTAEKYTCVVKHSPPILESRELIHWLCSHLAVYFTKMSVGLWGTFWFTLFANLAAIARAMEEWERRKEEGEVVNEPETEEENIYAVSKEQEVHCRHFANWACVSDWVDVESKCTVELFADTTSFFFLLKVVQENDWKFISQNIPIAQFDATPTQAQRQISAHLLGQNTK